MSTTYSLSIKDPNQAAAVDGYISNTLPAGSYRQVGSATWLIKDDTLTTKELSEKIFDSAKGQRNISHIVVRFDSFWGWHDKDIWEWISAK
ncbi:MAG: hypothetical protein V4650_14050 [Pseudomonadota bacterium]